MPLLHGAGVGLWDEILSILGVVVVLIIVVRLMFFSHTSELKRPSSRDDKDEKSE